MCVLRDDTLGPILMLRVSGHYRVCRRDRHREEDDGVRDSECDQHLHATGQGKHFSSTLFRSV